MASLPISPTINGDVYDKDLFASPLDRDSAGFGVEDDDGSLVDDSSTVAGAIDEEDEIDGLRTLTSASGKISLQSPTFLNGSAMI